jgi:hypothetical protein
MATTHAETGDIAAKADTTSAPVAATNSAADGTTEGTTEAGKADVVEPEAPKSAEKPAEKPKKEADKGEKKPKKDEKAKESTKKVADAAKKLVDTALDEAGKQVAREDTKKIKVLRSHPEFAYHPGEEGELPADKADFLIAGGFAQPLVPAITDETED